MTAHTHEHDELREGQTPLTEVQGHKYVYDHPRRFEEHHATPITRIDCHADVAHLLRPEMTHVADDPCRRRTAQRGQEGRRKSGEGERGEDQKSLEHKRDEKNAMTRKNASTEISNRAIAQAQEG